MTTPTEEHERLLELLPWHATGRLDTAEAAHVERQLETDAELRRHYELVLEELAATVESNEAARAPAPDLGDRLMARIEDHERVRRPAVARQSFDLAGWLGNLVEDLRPRQVGWAMAALMLAILIQAAVIAALLASQADEPAFVTASGEQAGDADAVGLILAFAPEAQIEEVAQLLERHGGRIVEGPLPGGLFRVAFAKPRDGELDEAELMAALQEDPAVSAVLPAR